MDLKYVIIHQLIKDQKDNEATSNLSKIILQKDSKIVDFTSKLHDLFTNHVYHYTHGNFEENHEKKFPAIFQEFVNDQNESLFISFTSEMIKELINEVKNTTAKGGFLVFCFYTIIQKTYFTVYMLRETRGFTFSNTESIVPEFVEHLDLDKLTMACQIDLKKYQEKIDKYLKFTKNAKMQDVSDYFYKWIAVDLTTKTNNKIYNDRFLEIINQIEPLPVIDGVTISRDDFKRRVHNFIKTQIDNNINLKIIGKYFYSEEPNKLLDFASSKQIEIDSEFRKDTKVLKKLWKFDAEIDSIRLAFKYEDFRTKIRIVGDESVIISSKKLVENIKQEISDEENGRQ